MKAVYCPYCGGRAKRNGRISSGSQRWRCTACGASMAVRCDDTATRLDEFLGWLLSKDSQAAMPGGGRSFRRRTAVFWEVWPMPECVDEVHRVVFVDGIYLARDLVVLIARLRRCGRKPWSSAAFGMLSPR
ncbi:transposase-like zinc-binding domain-containing protein [Collinsella bouchesdurhonensis]|uniref:transposase-like zinc-binding domain-containing protein n=1 Tax=Collinsella bouchesdurhonensis TaxID=1907654 RepID=UPI003F89A2B7